MHQDLTNVQEQDIFTLYNNHKDNESIYCTNEYGFLVNSFEPNTCIHTKDLKRMWYEIIEKNRFEFKNYKKSPQVEKLIKYGIPISLKYTLWKIFASKHFTHDYEYLKRKKNEYVHQIHVDIQRTFRDHFLFTRPFGRGQSELFNILVAFSNYKPQIGYCQGLSNIAAILLMYFPEEEAFEMMVNIIENNKLETLFDKKLSKIKKIQFLQEEVFKIVVPDVLFHLLDYNIDISIYAISWYLTLFSRFNIKYVLRFWDLFLFYGFSIFLFISTAIIDFFSTIILELKGEQLVEFMSKIDSFELDIEYIIRKSVKMFHKMKYLNLKNKLNN